MWHMDFNEPNSTNKNKMSFVEQNTENYLRPILYDWYKNTGVKQKTKGSQETKGAQKTSKFYKSAVNPTVQTWREAVVDESKMDQWSKAESRKVLEDIAALAEIVNDRNEWKAIVGVAKTLEEFVKLKEEDKYKWCVNCVGNRCL